MLTGPIPETLGELKLESLALDQNKLSGSIPETLGMIVSLQYLFLHANQLIGNIPLNIGDLPVLNTCDVRFNSVLCREEGFTACGTDIPGILVYFIFQCVLMSKKQKL
jgi:hypothetical protein